MFIKILLFVFVALVTNVKVTSAAITFSNIQEITTSFLFHSETPKTICKVIKNDEANCCQNGNDLLAYRSWGKRVDNLPRAIDIFKGRVDPTKPFMTISPKR